jgi:hypothetical protein
MLGAAQGTWTRSPVKIWTNSILKVCQKLKGVDLFVSNVSTICLQESIERVAQKLLKLKSFSVNHNISSVNEIVKTLLRIPEFWLFCYNNIKNNLGTLFLNGTGFVLEKHITLDIITLDYFQNLSISIFWGNFNFGFTCNVLKLQGNIKFLRIAGLRNKIVQKGMSVILEQVSEHKFLNCNFGFRRERFSHDALIYISQNVSPGLWAIEGCIPKCFNRLNYKRLVNLISKNYVSQQVFIDLIYKVLKIELVFIKSRFKKHKTLYIQQSSAVSFILYNIYLHELDAFIVESNLFSKFWNNKQAAVNLNNKKFIKLTKEKRLQGDVKKKYENTIRNYVF